MREDGQGQFPLDFHSRCVNDVVKIGPKLVQAVLGLAQSHCIVSSASFLIRVCHD